jgi:hypothetical protein
MLRYRSLAELEPTLDQIRQAPADTGRVELIVCRPDVGQRAVLAEAQLSLTQGLVGDSWRPRGYRKTPDGMADPDMQVTLMNVRVIAALAPDRALWPPAGDQFFVDFDLSKANLPPGSRLAIGGAVLEVTAEPHLGCRKFADRFGKDAVLFVNSDIGKALNLRGVNARVIQEGLVRNGDSIRKLPSPQLSLPL